MHGSPATGEAEHLIEHLTGHLIEHPISISLSWGFCLAPQAQRVGGKSYLRDRVLCERQVLHQDVQAFVFLIQELPDPSVGKIMRRQSMSLVLCSYRNSFHRNRRHSHCSKDGTAELNLFFLTEEKRTLKKQKFFI